MAFDYRISAPCLLDFMDDAVLKSDISLGVLETEQTLMKGSPSHESDSGCSDMLDEGSVSPSRSENSMSPGLFDLDVFSNQSVEDFDSELQSYLNTGSVLGSEEASFLQEPDLQINMVQPFSSASPPIDVDDKDPDYIPPKSKRIIQSVAIRPNNVQASTKENLSRPTSFKPEVLRVLPSKAPLVSNQNSARTPAIKVVKVIKAPVASSSTDIDSVLYEALDERNRKNAVQAKINREKKKQYINSLEQEIEQLRADNCTLKDKNDEVISERDSLLEEVNYLKNILANQSALASLLKNIPGDPKVKLSSSFKRKISADHDYTREVKRSRSSASVGVCLHVDKDEVSLEFCAKCATMAKS